LRIRVRFLAVVFGSQAPALRLGPFRGSLALILRPNRAQRSRGAWPEPVVGLGRPRHLARDGLARARHELFRARVGRVANDHQGQRVDSGISIAPVLRSRAGKSRWRCPEELLPRPCFCARGRTPTDPCRLTRGREALAIGWIASKQRYEAAIATPGKGPRRSPDETLSGRGEHCLSDRSRICSAEVMSPPADGRNVASK
jgi:hypothetical protein